MHYEYVLSEIRDYQPWAILGLVGLALISLNTVVALWSGLIRVADSSEGQDRTETSQESKPQSAPRNEMGAPQPENGAGQPPGPTADSKLRSDQKNFKEVLAAEETHEQEEKKFHLEALKALRDSSFQRWDKRRSYEWQLSISIWTAMAAFCALLLNKDTAITNGVDVASWVAVFGSIIVIAHFMYLRGMFTHTIGDAGIMRWAEREIFKVVIESTPKGSTVASKQDNIPVDKDNLPVYVREMKGRITKASGHLMYPNLSRYGLIQVLITYVLVAAAIACVLRRPQPAAKQDDWHYEVSSCSDTCGKLANWA